VAARPPSQPAPTTGKFLILDDDQLIEGDIRLEGDHYCIVRGPGETTVPSKRVIDLVATRQQAFEVVRARSNPRDWDERIRLIHWCMQNGLRSEALGEALALKKYRPDDPSLRALIVGLENLKEASSKPVAPSQPPVPGPVKQPDKVIEIEPEEYNREAFPTFVVRVQPILMNTCASCHATGQPGAFTLVRTSGGSNRKSALFNLASVLKQINRADLASSPLLVKAVTAHGQAVNPPLRDRQALAYQTLESWVESAVGTEGAPMPPPMLPAVAVAPKPAVEEKVKPEPKKEQETPLIFGETSTSKPKPEPQTEAKDRFDPAIFNGTIEPKK
jgi:hypothetical protein